MLTARLGGDSDALREQAKEAFQGTQGNPYFLEQLIEGFDAETGQFRTVPLSEIIDRKLTRLPKEAASLLEAIAIAGQAVRLDEAAAIAEQTGQAFSTVTHMRSERLVRLIGSSNQQLLDTYHDKIRETVLEGLEDSHRRELHIRFGEMLEQQENITAMDVLTWLELDAATNDVSPITSDRIFDLAYHFHAADDSRGFIYQLMAGELSHRAYASEDALEFLKRAEASLPPDASDAIRYRLWERLGSSHARLKMLEDALELYDRAIPHASSSLARAQTYTGLAFANATLARHSAFVADCDLALNELGSPRPISLIIALPRIVQMAVRIFLLPRARWKETLNETEEAKTNLEQKILVNMTYALFETPGVDLIYCIFRVGALAVASEDRVRFAFGMSTFAGALSLMGWPAGGRRQLLRAETIADDVVDAEMRGKLLLASGNTHAGSRDLQLANDELCQSLPLLEKAGAHWQMTYCIHVNRHLQQVIGTSTYETELAEKVLAIAESIGDIRAQCWGQYDIASGVARAGNIASAKDRIEKARTMLNAAEETGVTESIFLCTEGYVLLQASDYSGARSSLERSWQICKSKFAFLDYNSRSLPLLIESITGPDWMTTPLSERKLLKRLCQEARLLLWTHPNLHPPIHRARGRAFWVLCKRKKAIRSFERAVQLASDLGADYDRARSMLDLAAVREDGRGELRREAIELLKRQESVIPYAERWLLGDQYDEQCVAPPPDPEQINEDQRTVQNE